MRYQYDTPECGEIIPHAEFPTQETYDYDTILDGQTRKLVRGRDFTRPVREYQSYIYKAAYRRGIRVQTRMVDEDTVIVCGVNDPHRAAKRPRNDPRAPSAAYEPHPAG